MSYSLRLPQDGGLDTPRVARRVHRRGTLPRQGDGEALRALARGVSSAVTSPKSNGWRSRGKAREHRECRRIAPPIPTSLGQPCLFDAEIVPRETDAAADDAAVADLLCAADVLGVASIVYLARSVNPDLHEALHRQGGSAAVAVVDDREDEQMDVALAGVDAIPKFREDGGVYSPVEGD